MRKANHPIALFRPLLRSLDSNLSPGAAAFPVCRSSARRHASTLAVMLYLRRHAGALTCLVIGILAANEPVSYL